MARLSTDVRAKVGNLATAFGRSLILARQGIAELKAARSLIRSFGELQGEVAGRFAKEPSIKNFAARFYLVLHELSNLPSVPLSAVAATSDPLADAGSGDPVHREERDLAYRFAQWQAPGRTLVACLTGKGLEFGIPRVGGVPTLAVWPEFHAQPIPKSIARVWCRLGITPEGIRRIVLEGVDMVEGLSKGNNLAETMPGHSRRWVVTAGPSWSLRLLLPK